MSKYKVVVGYRYVSYMHLTMPTNYYVSISVVVSIDHNAMMI
ncbi:hypothetical protein [Enterococcus faecium]